jgi:hypothetical protein
VNRSAETSHLPAAGQHNRDDCREDAELMPAAAVTDVVEVTALCKCDIEEKLKYGRSRAGFSEGGTPEQIA